MVSAGTLSQAPLSPSARALRWFPAAGLILLGSVLYATMVGEIWRVAILAVGATVTMAVLGPAALLFLVLATSGISLAPLTAGDRSLLVEWGGLNLEGFRLLAVVGVGVILCGMRESLRSAILTRKAYLLFLGFAALSLAWTTSRFDGLRLLCKLLYPFLGYALAMEVCRTKGPRFVRAGIVAGAMIATAAGLVWRALSGEWTWMESPGRYEGALSATTFGLYCSAVALPIYGWATRSGSWKLYLLFSLLVAQTVATGTRTAVLALAAGLVALDMGLGARRRALLVVITGVTLWFAVPTLGARTGSLAGLNIESGVGALEVLNSSGRWLIWADVWSGMVAGGGLWGQGIGSSAAFLMGRFTTTRLQVGAGTEVHSEYLRILAELGPIGLVLFLFAFGSLLVALARRLPPGMQRRGDAIIAGSAILALLVASATDNTLGYYPYALLSWVLAGIALASSSESQEDAT